MKDLESEDCGKVGFDMEPMELLQGWSDVFGRGNILMWASKVKVPSMMTLRLPGVMVGQWNCRWTWRRGCALLRWIWYQRGGPRFCHCSV